MRRRPLLDTLCSRDPDRTREELLSLVLCGDVTVNGERVREPRVPVDPDAVISIARSFDAPDPYVSRGGLKLEHAIEAWHLEVRGRVFVDAGSSTGGFTDCLLRRGATAVHAVDVGYNQLDYRLRTDDRVIVHERTNIMEIDALEPPADAAVADLSFRSLHGAAKLLVTLAREHWAVVLVKPQFEWRSPGCEFNGVVPDAELPGILLSVLSALAEERVVASRLIESPIRGRRGNREFLALVHDADVGGVAVADSEALVAAVTS